MSSNRGFDIAVWDVLRIIRCPRYRISFPWEILLLNNPDEFLCHLGFIVSLRFDVLAVRYRVGSAPSLMQVFQFPFNICSLLVHTPRVSSKPRYCWC